MIRKLKTSKTSECLSLQWITHTHICWIIMKFSNISVFNSRGPLFQYENNHFNISSTKQTSKYYVLKSKIGPSIKEKWIISNFKRLFFNQLLKPIFETKWWFSISLKNIMKIGHLTAFNIYSHTVDSSIYHHMCASVENYKNKLLLLISESFLWFKTKKNETLITIINKNDRKVISVFSQKKNRKNTDKWNTWEKHYYHYLFGSSKSNN